jgi:hypothetical protein
MLLSINHDWNWNWNWNWPWHSIALLAAAPTPQELADLLPGRTWVGLFTEYAAKNEIKYKASGPSLS